MNHPSFLTQQQQQQERFQLRKEEALKFDCEIKEYEDKHRWDDVNEELKDVISREEKDGLQRV
jgi:hypothetical protein